MSFQILILSFFMTLFNPKTQILVTSNATRSISMTSIQPNVNSDATSCLLLSILGLEFSSKQFLAFCSSSFIFNSKLWRISDLTFQLSSPTHSPADASFLEGKYIADNHSSEHHHVVLVGPLHRRSLYIKNKTGMMKQNLLSPYIWVPSVLSFRSARP